MKMLTSAFARSYIAYEHYLIICFSTNYKLDRNSIVPVPLIFLFDVVCLGTLTQINLYDINFSEVVYSTDYRDITIQDRKEPQHC